MLREIETLGADSKPRVVLADMEAGLGTLSRLEAEQVDYVLVLALPTPKSLEVARRAAQMAREGQIGQLLVVANRIRNDQELAIVREALPGQEILAVPDDMAIEQADRQAKALLDVAPDSSAMQAFRGLVDRLLQPATCKAEIQSQP